MAIRELGPRLAWDALNRSSASAEGIPRVPRSGSIEACLNSTLCCDSSFKQGVRVSHRGRGEMVGQERP